MHPSLHGALQGALRDKRAGVEDLPKINKWKLFLRASMWANIGGWVGGINYSQEIATLGGGGRGACCIQLIGEIYRLVSKILHFMACGPVFENLLKIYRESKESISNFYRVSVDFLLKFYRKSIEILLKLRWKFVECRTPRNNMK